MSVPAAKPGYASVGHTVREIPTFIYGNLEVAKTGKLFSILPLLPTDRKAVKAFFDKEHVDVADKIDRFYENHLKGNPLSAYVLRSYEDQQIVGLLTFLPDDQKENLGLKLYVKKDSRRGHLALSAWTWTVEEFLPLIAAKKIPLAGKPFLDGSLVLTGVPDFWVDRILAAGFAQEQDGDKKVYKMALGKLLKQEPAAPKPWSFWDLLSRKG